MDRTLVTTYTLPVAQLGDQGRIVGYQFSTTFVFSDGATWHLKTHTGQSETDVLDEIRRHDK